MKNLAEQGAWRSAYVHTRKTGNAGQADFSWLPAGLGLNAISLISVNRP